MGVFPCRSGCEHGLSLSFVEEIGEEGVCCFGCGVAVGVVVSSTGCARVYIANDYLGVFPAHEQDTLNDTEK